MSPASILDVEHLADVDWDAVAPVELARLRTVVEAALVAVAERLVATDAAADHGGRRRRTS